MYCIVLYCSTAERAESKETYHLSELARRISLSANDTFRPVLPNRKRVAFDPTGLVILPGEGEFGQKQFSVRENGCVPIVN